ncbi:exodeoxyribonuclease V subunit gamma [Candidatus Annandia pinicola]|uniref:exodeoxyribonuclease V subunit gamma n=1 Tax=Candidatus Annandia pinicola TaxID=1345117 RepID=UPI001D0102BC|nr:exodeoxyribonuclease V subunit gamma [Candidatus Annandia pinicola]UDG80423.1 RecBCD enzyme subunit RecC [Candidatus Annandia pinicola]
MIYIHNSNNINVLKENLYLILKNNCLNNNVILFSFPHINFLRLIKKFILKKNNFYSNMYFMLHNDLFSLMLNYFLLKKKKKKKCKNLFYNKINKILSINKNYKIIKKIIKKKFKKKIKISILKFSIIICNIFFKYLLYKSILIDNNKNNKYILNFSEENKIWKIYLWKNILNFKNNLYYILKILLKKNNLIYYIKNNILPKKIIIFNTNNLSIYHLNIINNIKKYFEIHIFFLNPCYLYWGNILKNYKNYSLGNIISLNFKNYKYGNYLLDLWGKLKRKQLNCLISIESIENNFFLSKNKNNILNKIQKNILELNNKNFFKCNYKNNFKKILKLKDDSIKINICDSKQKEIEVLYDYLYKIFKNNKSLEYHDIIILSKDINLYYHYIKSTFNKFNKDKFNLPFSIIGHKFSNIMNLLNIIDKLIKILNNNYYFEDIIYLLNINEISERFKINNKYMIFFKNIILKLKNKYKNIIINKIDFFYSIKKIILSKNKIEYVFLIIIKKKNKIIFYEKINNNILDNCYFFFIKNIIKFINCLNKWNKIFLKKYKYKKTFINFIKQFFLTKKNNIKNSLKYIKKKYEKFFNEILLFNDNKISIKIIQKKIKKNIKKKILLKQKIIFGSINFCNIENMISIPFKIVCLIGLDNSFYKKNNKFKLSLEKYNKKIKILDKYNYNKYIFLEILISANYKLYISYTLDFLKNNKMIDKPIVIKNLFDYITNIYCNSNDSVLKIKKIRKILLKKFFNFYKTIDVTYNKKYIKYKYNNNFIKKKIEFENYNNYIDIKKFKKKTNYIKNNIFLEEFKNFWYHPIKSFFKIRLNVNFSLINKNIDIYNEKKNSNYKIKNKIYYKIMYYYLNKKKNNFLKKQQLLGLIPFGVLGKIMYKNYEFKIKNLFRKIKLFPKIKKKYINIFFKKKNFIIKGYLNNITDNGLRKWKNNYLNFSDGLIFWIEHLIYCLIGGNKNSCILGLGNSNWTFTPISPNLAKKYLLYYIGGYLKGMKSPLLLLPKSGGEWLKIVYNNYYNKNILNEEILLKAKQKMIYTFKGYGKHKGEQHDPYINRIIDHLDKNCINNICKNSIKWILPFLCNHIKNKKNK